MSTAAASTPSVHLRLTARGRAVFSVMGAIVISMVMAAVILGGASATASGVRGFTSASQATSEQTTFTYVQVESGQSLWQVAESVAPDADPREVISDIVRLNQLPSSEVQAGQQLAIPIEYDN